MLSHNNYVLMIKCIPTIKVTTKNKFPQNVSVTMGSQARLADALPIETNSGYLANK